MLFFDLALILIVSFVVLALVVGAASVVSGFLHPVNRRSLASDCRDETLILHGEMSRDCE